MSIKSAMACIRKLRADRKFKAKFTRAKNIDEKLKIAKAAGFAFTLPELKKARDKMTRLSLKQLERAAGGAAGAGCNAGASATSSCTGGNSAGASCGGGSGVASSGGCKNGSGDQQQQGCHFGSGDWSGNASEMASEGTEEVVEMAEL